ncbi:Ribonuclease P protein subunit p21, partial [Coemansia asiatica]
MGKKAQKDQGGSLPNREIFERMNFLYQSSRFFATLAHAPTAEHSNQPPTPVSSSSTMPLARFYMKEMRQVARKSVLRLSPHIKREMCQICSSPLVPGVSCKKRVKGKGNCRRLITTCMYCGGQKRIMANSKPD